MNGIIVIVVIVIQHRTEAFVESMKHDGPHSHPHTREFTGKRRADSAEARLAQSLASVKCMSYEL